MKRAASLMTILNPICGYFMLAVCISGYWPLIFPLALCVFFNVNFYLMVNEDERKLRRSIEEQIEEILRHVNLLKESLEQPKTTINRPFIKQKHK